STRHSDIDANGRPLPCPTYCPAKLSNLAALPLVASAKVAVDATDVRTLGTAAVKTEPMSRVRSFSSRFSLLWYRIVDTTISPMVTSSPTTATATTARYGQPRPCGLLAETVSSPLFAAIDA